MKKLQTKSQKSKTERIKQLAIGFTLIFLMLFSTLGYALLSGGKTQNSGNFNNEETIIFNGVEFTNINGYWNFNFNGRQFNTIYNPEEIFDIPVLIQSQLSNYQQKPLYFVGEINEPALEIIRNLNPIILRTNSACLIDINCTIDAPIKNPEEDNIIIIMEPQEGQNENIYQQDKAIFITASFENQLKYADAFLFKTIGI